MNFAPHPGATRRFGPPLKWDVARNGECGTLEIADVVGQGGLAFLAALNTGAAIILGISGTVHPVVYLGVTVPPQHDQAPEKRPEAP